MDNFQAQFDGVRRVADANRRRLYLFSRRPQPPRGPKFNSNGYVTWDEPQEKRNVTHFNIYAGSETSLYRRYPVGTTVMNDLTPTDTLIWVSAFNEESGLESVKVQARVTTAAGIEDAYVPPPPAGPASNVTGFTAGSARVNADQGGEMVRLNGSWTVPSSNYTGARIIGQISGETAWTILATVGATETSFNGPWMPAPRSAAAWTLKVQGINDDGVMRPLDGSTPTAATTIAAGVAGYDLGKVLAGSYDTVTFNVVAGKFVVTNVDFTKAWNFNASEFEVSAGAFRVKGLVADKINAGTLKVGGYIGGGAVPGQILIVDNDNSTMLGWIGKSSDNAYRGAWFPVLRVGGTDPSSAVLIANSSTLTLKGAQLAIGPGTSGGNGKLLVYNGTNIIGWIGTDGSNNGGWFKQLWVGGSDPASAQFYCDALGNAHFAGTLDAATVSSLSLTVGQITGWNGATIVVGGSGVAFSYGSYSTTIFGNSINTGSVAAIAGDISIGIAGNYKHLGNTGYTGTLPVGARAVCSGGLVVGYV